jgi:ABC-type antimicrobial peptide transport system permease subunit
MHGFLASVRYSLRLLLKSPGFTLVLSEFLGSLLYGVGGNDPITIAASIVVLSLAALLACLLPALRAIRINPITALRE